MNDDFIERWRLADKSLRSGDILSAIKQYSQIYKLEDPRADYALIELGNAYAKLKDYDSAKGFYQRAIYRLNDPVARCQLATLYGSGVLGERYEQKAFHLLMDAWGCREPRIYLLLSKIYKQGIGVPANREKAKRCLLRAYRYGNLMALRGLAHYCKNEGRWCSAIVLEIKASRKIWKVWRNNPGDPRLRTT